MQNFRKIFFWDFWPWLDRAHRVTSRNIILNISEQSFLKKLEKIGEKKAQKSIKSRLRQIYQVSIASIFS
jgi:hypothetical protein